MCRLDTQKGGPAILRHADWPSHPEYSVACRPVRSQQASGAKLDHAGKQAVFARSRGRELTGGNVDAGQEASGRVAAASQASTTSCLNDKAVGGAPDGATFYRLGGHTGIGGKRQAQW